MLYVNIEKRLSSYTLRVSFETDEKILGLFGASGAGKSMTLKCIAGIEKPDSGVIILNDRVLFDSDKKINLKPQERGVGYLFQEYALFPNMTVRGNILAALHHIKRGDRSIKADALIKQFQIAHLAEERPGSLSGGERQRAALARLIASEPELLLLDEPFSSLDTMLKCTLIPFVKETVSRYGKGCIMVSHDVGEIAAVCEQVTVIREGRAEPVQDTGDFIRHIKEAYQDIGLYTNLN
jgi:molybdate transport system ATP-binding protein